MTPQCGRSVVQVLVVRVDIGAVIYDDTPVLGGLWFSLLISDSALGVVLLKLNYYFISRPTEIFY